MNEKVPGTVTGTSPDPERHGRFCGGWALHLGHLQGRAACVLAGCAKVWKTPPRVWRKSLLLWTSQESDIQLQVEALKAELSRGPNALCLASLDTASVMTELQECIDKISLSSADPACRCARKVLSKPLLPPTTRMLAPWPQKTDGNQSLQMKAEGSYCGQTRCCGCAVSGCYRDPSPAAPPAMLKKCLNWLRPTAPQVRPHQLGD